MHIFQKRMEDLQLGLKWTFQAKITDRSAMSDHVSTY